MSRQHILPSLALVVMLGVVGCTEEIQTTSPAGDTTAPAPVLGLQGYTVNGSDPAIQIGWKAGPELDLAGYHVYRSADGGSSGLVATVTQPTWNDRAVLKSVSYVYEVAAFDQDQNEGARAVSSVLRIDAQPTAHPYDID